MERRKTTHDCWQKHWMIIIIVNVIKVCFGNLSRPFWFSKQLWNIPTPLWFSRNPLRERPKHLHLNNTLPSENYTWNSLGLQLTQKKTRSRKNSLRLHHSVFWLACGRKSRWNMTANQKTANHKYCLLTNQRKKQNLVFEHMIRQVNVSCPASPSLRWTKY